MNDSKNSNQQDDFQTPMNLGSSENLSSASMGQGGFNQDGFNQSGFNQNNFQSSQPNWQQNKANEQANHQWQNPQYGAGSYSQNSSYPNAGAAYGASQPQMPSNEASSTDKKTWALISHLSMPISMLISLGFVSWLLPLIIYLVYRERDEFIRKAAANALNFAITITVLNILASVLFVVGAIFIWLVVPIGLMVIGGIIWLYIFIAGIVFPILGALKVTNMEVYNYPLTPTIIK